MGTLASAAIARMDEVLPWYRAMPAENRSWVNLVAQAGVAAFVEWFRAPDAPQAISADVFGTAPRELTRSVTLQQTVELVRVVIAVVEGSVDAYVHAGGQFEWDSAAPVAVAHAAGLIATRLDGSPIEYNKPDPWSPDLVVCHPALVAHVRRLLAEAGPDDAPGAPA